MLDKKIEKLIAEFDKNMEKVINKVTSANKTINNNPYKKRTQSSGYSINNTILNNNLYTTQINSTFIDDIINYDNDTPSKSSVSNSYDSYDSSSYSNDSYSSSSSSSSYDSGSSSYSGDF